MLKDKEIGSEFMVDSYKRGKNEYCNLVDFPMRHVLSGRTGLYLIAQELKSIGISSVSLPTYCCGSMITPFVDSYFQVSFYDGMAIPNSDAVLIMDYFGFIQEKTVCFAKRCKEAGVMTIIDATQTAFSKSKLYEYADFIIVSYRKWLDCLCATVYSKRGFITPEYTMEKNDYVDKWREASKGKKHYLENDVGDKQGFLDMYAKANSMLAEEYIGYKACVSEIEILENCDSNHIRETRRKNAKILINGLFNKVDLMFEQMSDEDCPLHVPIMLEPRVKAEIRKALIQESIYCPCHWPINEQYPYHRTLYHDREMSLICDQRYNEEDMVREVEAIIKVLNRG